MQQLDLDGHWTYDNILWIGSSKQQAQARDDKQALAKDHKQALAAWKIAAASKSKLWMEVAADSSKHTQKMTISGGLRYESAER